MNAKTQTELTMKIGSNKDGVTETDLNSIAFEIEQMANKKFPECRVHVGAKEYEGLNQEEMTTILEAARYCLGAVFSEFAEDADISDEYLVDIREKLENVTEGVG